MKKVMSLRVKHKKGKLCKNCVKNHANDEFASVILNIDSVLYIFWNSIAFIFKRGNGPSDMDVPRTVPYTSYLLFSPDVP